VYTMNRSKEGVYRQKNLKHFLCSPQIITAPRRYRWYLPSARIRSPIFLLGLTFYARRYLGQQAGSFRLGVLQDLLLFTDKDDSASGVCATKCKKGGVCSWRKRNVVSANNYRNNTYSDNVCPNGPSLSEEERCLPT